VGKTYTLIKTYAKGFVLLRDERMQTLTPTEETVTMSDSKETRASREATLSDRPDLRCRFEAELVRQGPDYQGYYLSAVAALARLDTATAEDIIESLSPEHRRRLLDPRRGLRHYIALLQRLVHLAEAHRPSLTVVRDE
jgi:hypothetical protein